MSLFGTSPTEDARPSSSPSSPATGRLTTSRSGGLFDDDNDNNDVMHKKTSASSLFADDSPVREDDASSPWDMPAPRPRKSRRDILRSLLPADDVPSSYVDVFDAVNREEGGEGRIRAGAISKLFAVAGLERGEQIQIMELLAPGVDSDDVSLEREEFNVLLAMVALGQEGEVISLDAVDERRR
ncbi:hypothetical protein E4U59_005326, partial [Claviceps monticola]